MDERSMDIDVAHDDNRGVQKIAPGATPLKVLALDVNELDAKQFAMAHGDAFFIVVSSPYPLGGMDELERRITRPRSVQEPDTGEISVGVFSLRKAPESTHPFISVGRTDDNDIAIHDETVSRFHAFLRWDHTGRWFLQDAKSKNGTTIDGLPVPRRGEGDPVELKPGTIVMFGSVTLHFADVDKLMQMAQLFTKRVA